MRDWKKTFVCVLVLAGAIAAQDGGSMPSPAKVPAVPKILFSEASRATLAAARQEAMKVRGLEGDAQLAALKSAAEAYDRAAKETANEPKASAQAAYTAGELWRRHGSVAEAERCYLMAVQLDAERYAQRGKLAAADMQRRAEKFEAALVTYRDAASVEPATARAQTARLWVGRVLQTMGRDVDALVAFRAALTSAVTPSQTIEACNYLANAMVAAGDFAGAAQALSHADSAISTAIVEKPEDAERLHKALESMSARRALQRAQDKSTDAAVDAQKLEQQRG